MHRVIEEQLPVSWIPGPTALIGGLTLSGLPLERFIFEGFLSAKPTARRKRLEAVKQQPCTVALYESPHRLLKTLKDIYEVLGDIHVVVARELTKLHEEVRRGSAGELLQYFEAHPPKGEIVVVFQPADG